VHEKDKYTAKKFLHHLSLTFLEFGSSLLLKYGLSFSKTTVKTKKFKHHAVSLGKTLNAVSHLGAEQSTRCGGPA